MKIILNVSKTNYSIVAKLYGSVTIDKVVYVYLHNHDALIRRDLYPAYKRAKNFEDFLLLHGDN
jgi:hypothetical protein